VSRDQKIRAVLYYISVAVFFAGLPLILSYTLGYKFDPAEWKFTRTGLISVKTQPSGASVFLNGQQLADKTPCSINELLPGKYTVELKLSGHYAYSALVDVRASAVSRMEKVLLFPLRPDVQKLNKEQVSWFWVDEDKAAYYVNGETKSVYRSDLDGDHFEKLAEFVPLEPHRTPQQWKLSPDRRRILYFNEKQIGFVELEPDPNKPVSFVLDFPVNGPIKDVYWYTDSYNAVVIAGTQVAMLETKPAAKPFVLMTLNSVPQKVFYESDKETVYFQDAQPGADNRLYENVYKLELRRKLYPFGDFMRGKKNE
jgi:hypothetical protein